MNDYNHYAGSVTTENQWQLNQLSGNVYVSAVPRENLDSRPLRNFRVRIPIARPETCLHGVQICPSWECIESWSLDYRLFFKRTGGGRWIAEQFNLDPVADIERKGIEFVPDPRTVTAGS